MHIKEINHGLQRNPSTAAIEKRSRSSVEGNRNSRRGKKEIGKAKAEQGIRNIGGCFNQLDAQLYQQRGLEHEQVREIQLAK